jgi:hypothetical protein
MRFVAAVLAVVACCATTAAWALDRPISGAKIVLKRSASGKKSLTFTSKAMNMPSPWSTAGRPVRSRYADELFSR